MSTWVETPPEVRQEHLLTALRRIAPHSLTITQAWELGQQLGFYRGGDGSTAKSDLQALVQRNQARRQDGYWRHMGEPGAERYKTWADNWSAR